MSAHSHGRFAPSPTGALHVGNLRTALLAWLFARSQEARLYMRMEDLDGGRVRPGVAEEQLSDLEALGIDWDGEVLYQSTRRMVYEEALAELRARGALYECFCTRAEIREAASAPHGPHPEGAYPGTCARLTRAQLAAKRSGGRPPALRLRAEAARVAIDDRLRGRVERVVDDVVVRRNDGTPSYHLAAVVDDAAQSIGEVVRGEDLLESAPRQALLAATLSLPEPRWAHVPLVVGADGQRLAKRHGAVTLAEQRSPVDALTWMARSLGLVEPHERVARASDLLDRFDPARLPTEPTRWDGR